MIQTNHHKVKSMKKNIIVIIRRGNNRTPAMAAGITARPWTKVELLRTVLFVN
jgi:hypothetical protein